jgi:leucyl-tRNA synthetase
MYLKKICSFDQPIPVEESELPLKLPDMDDFAPGNDPQGT